MVVYGIPNCDTIRKARRWLDQQGVDYQFHDFRKQGLEPKLLKSWVKQVGWKTLLNRRGTSWRKLPEQTREKIDESSAIKIMLDNPAIIKRPVLVHNKQVLVGFSEQDYQQLLNG